MAAPEPWREPSPYPPYPRAGPHSPPQPVRPLSFVGPQGQPYYAAPMRGPAIPGFYNPALSQPQPGPATPPGSASAPPAFPQPRVGLPPSLMPGRTATSTVPRSHSNDYFFQNESRSPPYGFMRHTHTEPAPPLPRKPGVEQQPPLPPKPPLPPSLPPSLSTSPDFPSQPTYNGSYFASAGPSPAPSAPPFPLSGEVEDDDALLNRVLEISAKETRLSQASGEPMLSEEEQIARALEESLKISSSQFLSSPPPDREATFISASPEQGPAPLPSTSHSSRDYSAKASQLPHKDGGGPVSPRANIAEQISADEALARQLQEELEEEEQQQSQSETHQSPSLSPPFQANVAEPPPSEPGLPQYDEVVSSPPPPTSAFYSSSLSAHFPADGTDSDGPSSRPGSSSGRNSLYRSISDKPVPSKGSLPNQGTSLGRSQSLGESSPTATTLAVPSLPAPTPQAPRPLSMASSALESVEDSKTSSPVSSTNGVEIMSNTQYLDAELLSGLCKSGCSVPSVSVSGG